MISTSKETMNLFQSIILMKKIKIQTMTTTSFLSVAHSLDNSKSPLTKFVPLDKYISHKILQIKENSLQSMILIKMRSIYQRNLTVNKALKILELLLIAISPIL